MAPETSGGRYWSGEGSCRGLRTFLGIGKVTVRRMLDNHSTKGLASSSWKLVDALSRGYLGEIC